MVRTPQAPRKRTCSLCSGGARGEGIDGKLLVARAADGGMQIVVIAGPGRIGEEAAHILLQAHGANALPVAQPSPAVGTGEEPVHVLFHLPHTLVHGGGVAKQEQHPVTGPEFSPSKRLSNWLQISMGRSRCRGCRRRALCPCARPAPIFRPVGGFQQITPVSHTLTLVPSGRSKSKGSSCHSWRRVRAKSHAGESSVSPSCLEYHGRIIRKASGLKINF